MDASAHERRNQELHDLLYGMQEPDPELLINLAPVLPASLLPKAIKIARRIERRGLRAQVLIRLAAHLNESERNALLREVIADMPVYRDDDLPLAFGWMVPHLPEELLPEALHKTFSFIFVPMQIAGIVALAPRLSKSLMDEALAHALNMGFDPDRISALTGLAPYLAGSRKTKIRQRIKQEVEALNDEEEKGRVAAAFAAPPSGNISRELDKAVAGAPSYVSTQRLLKLAPRLPGPLKAEVLREVRTTIDASHDREWHWYPGIASLAARPDYQTAVETTGRFLNVCLTTSPPFQVIERSTDLEVKGAYNLRVDIGRLSPESVITNPGNFPADKLPSSNEGWWLEAIAASDDFKVEPKRHDFFLPVNGPSWVCTCQPGEPHHCTPAERQPYLYIPVQAPAEPGSKTLRLTIYFRKNAVQSLLLTAHVGQAGRAIGGNHAEIDFSLTARLDTLDFLSERRASILINQNMVGTHRLIINGRADKPLTFSLSDNYMQKVTGELRAQLDKIHYSRSGLLGIKNNYDPENAKPKEEFIQDLESLAGIGWGLYDAISNKIDLSVDEPGTIQIARAATEFVFPWAFIYDIPKESYANWQLCQLLDDWDGKSPFLPAGAKRCPYDQNHAANTLCPFGFWGYRHILELPPSINLENTDRIRQVIHAPGEFDFIFIQNTTLDTAIASKHIDVLHRKISSSWEPVLSLEKMIEALNSPDPEIVYFYVHGKRLEGNLQTRTSLLVGNDKEIVPSDIKAWYKDTWSKSPDHWSRSSPLIFINGCHTTDLLPDSPVSFVDEFCRAAAAGVIGTEITISQRVASEMAELFLTYFVQKTSAGEAIRLARLDLLNKGNVLGLVYTAYCAAELTLE